MLEPGYYLECIVGGVRIFFAKDFLQLTFSSLPFFDVTSLYYILTFPKNIIFHVHTANPMDIELKINVYKTHVRSNYVLFPGGCEGTSDLNKSY